MRIIFVRHGHPDYQQDCLTELGHRHAEAAAQRLSEETIDRFFTSSCGRAVETAEHIAARFQNPPLVQLDFMREIRWRTPGVIHDGQPWKIAADCVKEGMTLHDPAWRETGPFSACNVVAEEEKIRQGFDVWMAELGYIREGEYYRVKGGTEDTVLLVSHGGSSSVVLAHLLNLQLPLLCKVLRPNFTAITVVRLGGEEGELVSPTVELANDARHIAGMTAEEFFR